MRISDWSSDVCSSDLVDAVKIGMIGSSETAHAVADYLLQMTGLPIIFDPVMVSTSGSALADSGTTGAFERLMRIAALVTPNLPELKALGGDSIAARYGCTVLAKGGHGEGEMLRSEEHTSELQSLMRI